MTDKPEARHKSFSRIPHAFIDSGFLSQLTGSEVKVFLVINRHADYQTGMAYPTEDRICELTKLCKDTVVKAIKGLAEKGIVLKKRAGRRFSFRNLYQVRELDLNGYRELLECIPPKKMVKRRKISRGKDGKFKRLPSNTENDIPQNADNGTPTNAESDICPKKTEKNENLEIEKKDKFLEKAGSAPARPLGRASPALNSKKSLKDYTKEELQEFIKGVGLDRAKKYLKRIGYDEKEIESLREMEGGVDEKTDTT